MLLASMRSFFFFAAATMAGSGTNNPYIGPAAFRGDRSRAFCYLGIILKFDRLREIRELKNLSQADIEKRTGLRPRYHMPRGKRRTLPSGKTLEKMARAMEMHL